MKIRIVEGAQFHDVYREDGLPLGVIRRDLSGKHYFKAKGLEFSSDMLGVVVQHMKSLDARGVTVVKKKEG